MQFGYQIPSDMVHIVAVCSRGNLGVLPLRCPSPRDTTYASKEQFADPDCSVLTINSSMVWFRILEID